MAIRLVPTVAVAGSRRPARLVAAIVCLCLVVWSLTAAAWDPGGGLITVAAQSGPLPPGAIGAGTVSDIRVVGAKRIELETIRSYLQIQSGDPWKEELVNSSLKSLLATGLFADVTLSRVGNALVVSVVENPIINGIAFEGSKKLSDKDLKAEIQLRPRVIYTRTRVQNDVRRILELYRRHGRFGATVEPKVIQLSENRVDLVFEINEGEFTGIRSINFVGNQAFSEIKLRGVIASRENRWYRFLSTSDSYDPDRLTHDGELLRNFYLTEGYADFRLVSAVPSLTPSRNGFILTFTLDEGQRYRFGKIGVHIKDLPPNAVLPLLTIRSGDWYNAEQVEKSISILTDALGDKGYAFLRIEPESRNRKDHTVDITFNVEEGPRVYVERIDIVGNVRTLDKVIRREMQLVEGDPFNATRMQRSQQGIKNLGFFKKVEVTNAPGSAPDQTVVTVEVEEQSSAEMIEDFVIRNQSYALLILGAALSLFLYVRFVRLLVRLVLSIPNNVLLGVSKDLARLLGIVFRRLLSRADPQLGNFEIGHLAKDTQFTVPLLYFRKVLIFCAIFLLGLFSLPLVAGAYAWLHKVKFADDTALLNPPLPARMLKPDAHTAIVLLHGWTGDAAHSWNSFTKLMIGDKNLDDVDIWPVDYPTYISRRHLPLGELARWLYTDFFVPFLLPRYNKIIIIAHSLGGVVARDVYIKNVLSRKESPVIMIISIGSPFSGARLAAIANAIGVEADYLSEVEPSSSYLSDLESNWGTLGTRPLSLCLWSPVDGVVDHDSAIYQCECQKPYPQWSHTELEKPQDRADPRYRTPVGSLLLHMNPTPAAPCD